MNPEAALRTAGFQLIAGVDEAGRGAYAGPLVIAAVILDPQNPLDEVGDSKSFSESKRAELAAVIKERALAYSIIVIEAEEIDTLVALGQIGARGSRAASAGFQAPSTRIMSHLRHLTPSNTLTPAPSTPA